MSANVLVVDVAGTAPLLRERGYSSATKNTVRALIRQKRLRPIRVGKKFYIEIEQINQLSTKK